MGQPSSDRLRVGQAFGRPMVTPTKKFDQFGKDRERFRLAPEQWIAAKEGKDLVLQVSDRGYPILCMGDPASAFVTVITPEIQLVDTPAFQMMLDGLKDDPVVCSHLDAESRPEAPPQLVLGVGRALCIETAFADNKTGDILRSDRHHLDRHLPEAIPRL